MSIANPILKRIFLLKSTSAARTLLCCRSDDFDLVIVCVCDVEGLVHVAEVDTQGVLQFCLIARAFFVAKVKEVKSVFIGTSDYLGLLSLKTVSPNG